MSVELRILFVYKFCTTGGVEAVLRNRLEILENMGVYADVLFFKDYGGRSIFAGNLEGHVFIIGEPDKVRKFILDGNYEYIISIDTPEIYEMTRGMDLRMILEVHTHYDDNRQYLKSILAYDQPTIAIMVPTDYFKGVVEKEIGDKIPLYTFSNFIGTGFKSEYYNRELPPIGTSRKAIGWIGRLDSLKNWPEFLDIAKVVLDHRRDVEFIVVGGRMADVTTRKAFMKKLQDNGLLPYVKWLPFYTHMPVLYKYLAATGGCFVSTSTAESFGMTVLESMFCKCPVICTNIGAFSEILGPEGKNGLQYDLGDIDDAACKINRIMDDHMYRQSIIAGAYEHVMINYDPEKIMNLWIDFLDAHKDR